MRSGSFLFFLITLLCMTEAWGQATAIAKPDAVCHHETSALSVTVSGGTGNYYYQWEPQDLIDGDNTLPEVETVCLSETTVFTCTVMDDSGSTFLCDVEVTVKPRPITYMGEDQYIAYNTAAMFTATDAGEGATYHWEPEDLIAEGQGTTTVTTVPLTIMHQFYLTVNQNGCMGLHFVNVDVGEQLHATVSADPPAICSGATTTLSALASEGMGQYTYLWEPAEWIEGDNQQATVTTVPLTEVPEVTFTCTVSDGNQIIKIDKQIAVYQYPEVAISPEGGTNNICAGASLDLKAHPGTGHWNYLWSTGETTPTITVQPTDPTTEYWLKVSSSLFETCQDQASIAVHVIGIDAEIVGYQEVFNASDLWHGLYNYSLVEHSGFDMGEVEWECDRSDWEVTKTGKAQCMLWVKSEGMATLTAKPSNVVGCDDALSIVINATEYVEEGTPVVKVYPNPTYDEVTVKATNVLSVNIIDVYGQVVKTIQSNHNDKVTFSIKDLSDSVYLVEVVTLKDTVIKRIVIAK